MKNLTNTHTLLISVMMMVIFNGLCFSDVPIFETPSYDDVDNQAFTISENQDAGEVVGRVKATHHGSFPMNYRIHPDYQDRFTIERDVSTDEGIIKSAREFDAEASPGQSPNNPIQVVVQAKAHGREYANITVNVIVTDVNEYEPKIHIDTDDIFETNENVPVGTEVDRVEIVDKDITKPDVAIIGAKKNLFEIVHDSGNFYLLKTIAPIDFETYDQEAKVRIEVDDFTNSSPPGIRVYKAFKIRVKDVNDPPIFHVDTPTEYSVRENVKDTLVGIFTADDQDSGDTITYSLLDRADASGFTIDSQSGELKTRRPLDYEIQQSYSITVVATDKSGLTDTVSIEITIIDDPNEDT